MPVVRLERYSEARAEEQQTALRDYGLSLGTAFQLIDDLLDFTSSEEALGKAAGADLLGGKVTLPLIYLRDADPESLEMVQAVLRERKYGSVKQADLLGSNHPHRRPRNRLVPALTSMRNRHAPRSINCRIRITATLYAPFPRTSLTVTGNILFHRLHGLWQNLRADE